MPVVVSIVCVVVVLGAGGLLTTVGDWYHGLSRPPWNPPDWLFGPAWTIIGGLVAWSAVLAWTSSGSVAQQRWTLVLFAVNAVVNILWSLLFFKLRRPDWALADVVLLWLSIAAPIVAFWPRSPLAAVLLVPYLAWVTFASVLNLDIVRRNAPFGESAAAGGPPSLRSPVVSKS